MTRLVEQRDLSPLSKGTAICLGAFDGLHLGHQALVRRARARGDHVGLVTFDPHPLQVLAPERAPRLLQTAVQRRRVCSHLGVEHLVLLPFDRSMSQMSAERFVDAVIIEGLRPTAVVVGEDFRFGRGRQGDGELLARRLAPAGIEVERVAPIPVPAAALPPGAEPSAKLGATAIRRAVEAGEVARAGAMLGRWHSVAGVVVQGARRGRTIGFPTANIHAPDGFLPAPGVYAGALAVWSPSGPHAGQVWPAVANLGRNPTFAKGASVAGSDAVPLQLEAHVLDQDLGESLYALDVEFSFVARLRGEQRFDGPAALVAQIGRDVAAARPLLASALPGVVPPPAP
ncbi:MAG: riboflavin biosynthesis protein RibF [Myxococcales bacterium]|nr:riboflavin biosynthesis protein RibF [Myxococcales bacterium]